MNSLVPFSQNMNSIASLDSACNLRQGAVMVHKEILMHPA